jgi:hypothetical protein
MTAITEMDLWEMFLDALEENNISYNNDQLDVIHKHMRQLEVELEAAE